MANMKIMTIAGAALVLITQAAHAETVKTFVEPRYAEKRLDWCLQWSANCGKPAADFFCQYQGFKTAKAFAVDQAPGENTLVVGSNKVCEQPGCDSFASITCSKPSAQKKTIKFNTPKYNGKRIDNCLTAGGPCGKDTANYYCKMKGYDSYTEISVIKDPSVSTIFLKSGANCFPGSCKPVQFIRCEKTVEDVKFDNND
jgi:hypothetical protein